MGAIGLGASCGGDEGAQSRVILDTWARFDARCDINRKGLHLRDGLRDVLGRQTSGKDDMSRSRDQRRPRPVDRLASSTARDGIVRVEQHRLIGDVGLDRIARSARCTARIVRTGGLPFVHDGGSP